MTSIVERLTGAISDRYRVLRELGAGGMATVYLAHDIRHERDVAVKVLHPDLGAALGAERFLTEIKTTARLQHPHILPLLESGEADGLLFYVMPLVEGETLRAKLDRERQLPLDEALRIATEAASALDYAHRHGVIHRDIKPENILIHDGRAVVADFGIALAVSAASGTRMTQTGLSLGTPQYMAPEQAMGDKSIDARADVYALGAVTYEMLTGEPPFSGATVQAIVAKVLTEKPMNPTAVRETVPRHVEATVLKALAKLPADRFATAAQFAEALARPEVMAATTGLQSGAAPVAARGVRRFVSASPVVWVAFAASVLLATLGWIRKGAVPAPAPVTKVNLPMTGSATPLAGRQLAISPDGSRIAYVGNDSARVRRIYLRTMDRLDDTPVAGTERGSSPFFSPDGESVGFAQDGKLRTVSLRGGSVTTLTDWEQPLAGGSWGSDSTIVISAAGSLYRVPAAGGAREPLITASAGRRFTRPALLPGARVLLAQMGDNGPSVVAIRLGDSSLTHLVPGGQHPQYVEGGALVYGVSDGSIFAVPFDAAALRVTGPAEPLTDQVVALGGVISRFAVARTGTLAYLAGLTVAGRDLVFTDRRGVAQVIPIGQRLYRFPRFSPDGRVLAFGVETRGAIGGDIWRYPVAGGAPLRLTADTLGGQPEWDPDGTSLVYARRPSAGARLELFRVSADGSEAPRPLLARPNPIFESRITPDRRSIVFREDAGPTDRNILMAPLDSPTVVRPVAATSFDEKGLALSPDGKWLAYVSNETGADEVYIRKLQEVSSRWPVTQGGGTEPRWIRTGELFFRKGDSVMVTVVELGAEPRVSAPRLLFTGNYVSTGYEPIWDVSPDGLRFAFVRATAAADTPMGLLLNWADHWRARRR